MAQKKDFINKVFASYPLVLVKSHEEVRVLSQYVGQLSAAKVLDAEGKENGSYKSFVWDIVDGVRQLEIANKVLKTGTQALPITITEPDPEDPSKMNTKQEKSEMNVLAPLLFLEQAPDNTVLFVKDYQHYLSKDYQDNAVLIRKIRNLTSNFRAKNKVLVFLSSNLKIPMELEKDMVVIDFKLPDRAELQVVLKSVCHATGAEMPRTQDTEALLDGALGMTAIEAENAFCVSLVEMKKLDASIIRREKADIVKKAGLLEVIETNETMADIGGLEVIKEWVEDHKKDFSAAAKAFGVVPPKGLLFLGIPGCGKSLTSKALAMALGLTLLRLDVGKVFGKYVGESENNMQACLDVAEAVAPCLLWMDEIEKGLSGNSGQGNEGHETTRRVFQLLLTWLEEKKGDVILVATANSIASLPPELISRFSESFFVDLPDPGQRLDIFKIQLKKVGRPNLFTDEQLVQVVTDTDNFNGREIRNAVQNSVSKAFSREHPQVQLIDLMDSIHGITPINRVKKEELERTRHDAVVKMGAKLASRPRTVVSNPSPTVEAQGTRRVNIAGSDPV